MLMSLLYGIPDESGESRHLSNYCCHIFHEGVGCGGEIARLCVVLWKGNSKLKGRLFLIHSYCSLRQKCVGCLWSR
jgi:hypothetical protein